MNRNCWEFIAWPCGRDKKRLIFKNHIYTSTQNYFNQGLVDRVLSTSYSSTDDATIQAKDANGNAVTGLQAYYISLYKM